VDELVGVQSLEPSALWAGALRGDGPGRAEALVRLRAHLAAAAKFELDRRATRLDGTERGGADSLVQGAVEAALTAILADLGRYRAQSRFATWTAKYAIRAAAAADEDHVVAGP
jgi:hypothetical protein